MERIMILLGRVMDKFGLGQYAPPQYKLYCFRAWVDRKIAQGKKINNPQEFARWLISVEGGIRIAVKPDHADRWIEKIKLSAQVRS